MRTLRSLPLEEKERLKIAEEALNVYAPLAHRMGVMKVKGELEDLAFKILHPEMFQVREAFLPNTSAPIITDAVNFSPRRIAVMNILWCCYELSLIHLLYQQLFFDLMRFLYKYTNSILTISLHNISSTEHEDNSNSSQ